MSKQELAIFDNFGHIKSEMIQTSVEATYENGKLFLEEPLPIPCGKVIVTVVEDAYIASPSANKPKRRFGSMKGSVTLPDDFNEPPG